MQLDDFSTPAHFDALLTSPERSLALLDQEPATQLGRLRRVQILFAHDSSVAIEDLEAELDRLDEVPTYGTRLMLKIEARLYEEVAAATTDPTSSDPLDLEESGRAHAMVGVAFRNLERPHRALEHLRASITLAHALNCQSRLDTFQLMWHQARADIEEPDLEGLELLLMRPHLNDRSRHWGQRMKAQALQELGAFDDALRALGPASLDTAADAEHREYLHALMGLPALRQPGEPLLNPDAPYVRLALAIWAAREGKRVHLRDLRGQPYEAYARLVEARSLLPVKRMAGAVLTILGDRPPRGVGQACVWSIYRLVAALREGQSGATLAASDAFRQCIQRLRFKEVAMKLLEELSPELKLAFLLGPLAGVVNGLSQMPLLTGQVIVCGGESVRLTGRIGRALVLDAAHHPEAPELSRSERSKFRKALIGFKAEKAVNVGGALRYALALYRAAVAAEDADATALWERSYVQLHRMLSDDVQSLFAEHPSRSVL